MKGIIDTHSHVYAEQFKDDLIETIDRARTAGIDKILLPNIDTTSTEALNKLVLDYPKFFYKMSGLHPCSVQDGYLKEIEAVKHELRKGDSIAVGEIGIDLYWDKTTLGIQKDAFKLQCEMAIEHDLPIVIHSRESIDIILEIIDREYKNMIKGVFHCFTGSSVQAQKIIDLGFIMGIGGVVTFKNSTLRDEIKDFSLEHFVLETDAPYLAPMPFRGKRNEPAYIVKVAEEMSLIFEMSVESIIEATRENALKLFNI